VHGLLVPASLRECVTPWKRQGTHVSFVRGVGPVALVLHLESVAFHPAGRPKPRRRFVRERADVEDWLRRADPSGENGFCFAPVDVHDLEPLSGEPSGVEDDEASAIGHEVGLRRRYGVEGKDAVA
jgi:hypothetical protein